MKTLTISNLKHNNWEEREQAILERIKRHYGTKLQRLIDDSEAREIAQNLLGFAKAIYGA